MNFNITIGQYYPTDSVIHRLDPRIKLLATTNVIVLLFIATDFISYGLIAGGILSIIMISKIPLKSILRGLRALIYIILFTVLLNLFFAPGETMLVEWGIIRISHEAVMAAIQMAFRLILLIITSSLLTLTTAPVSLTSAIEVLLGPLKILKFPIHEIAMMMTIALRFIPTLLEEAEKITKAQMARGAAFDQGNIVRRAKSLIPILVPLFVSAFRRADDLAMAMESRCYRGDMNRTRMKDLKFLAPDFVAMGVLMGATVILIMLRIYL